MRQKEFWQALLSLDLPPLKSRELLKSLGTHCVSAQDFVDSPHLDSKQRIAAQFPNIDFGDIFVVSIEEEEYPANLRLMSSAPVALMVHGNLSVSDENAVAIVGTRKPSTYGRAVARKLAMELAKQGITIISGAAHGIDTEAHKGALQVGGRTIAVLGSAIDRPYPPSNIELLHQISSSGAVVSQFALGTKPDYWRFPARNATIAGLAKAVILVEVPEKSGALVTASIAAEEGRHVFVTPGPIDSLSHRGSFRLINDGATLLYTPDQIFEALGIRPTTAAKSVSSKLTDTQKKIFDALTSTPELPDNLSEKLGEPAGIVLAELTQLELEGLVQKSAGGYIRL